MKFGYALFLIYCVCGSGVVRSAKGLPAQYGAEKTDTNTTEDILRLYTAVLLDDPPTFNNFTSMSESEFRINQETENINGTIKNDSIDSPHTMRGGSRRLGSSRYKSGRQQVSIGDLTVSDDLPRHGALMHKINTKFDAVKGQSSNKEVPVDSPDMGLDTSENSYKKKKRVPTSSATPSVQIVILVVGAVLGCVLLTGFIRWRVRGRLDARKQKEMADDFAEFQDGNDFDGTEMDTIYECDCEEGQVHSCDSLVPDISHEEDGTQFDEMSCSHRFDIPDSFISHTYSAGHHSRLDRPKSPKSGRDLGLVRGAKRRTMSRRRYGNKCRYSRHQRKRLEKMFVQKLETIPMENTTPIYEDSKGSTSFTSLLDQTDKNGNRRSTNEQHLSPTSSQPPLLVKQGSPTPQRSVLSSLLNSWRSLSFNRDWVGKMWLEKHNIRRISDIIRGRATPEGSTSQKSSRESLSSVVELSEDVSRQSARITLAAEIDLASPGNMSHTSQNVVFTVNETSADIHDIRASSERHTDSILEQDDQFLSLNGNVNLAPSRDELDAGITNAASPNTNIYSTESDCPQRMDSNHFIRCWSFSEPSDKPPEYESLLGSGSNSRNIISRSNTDHPRYQRRRRRNRIEGRDRLIRHVYNSVPSDTESTHSDSDSSFALDRDDESSPLANIHRYQSQTTRTNIDNGGPDIFPLATPAYQPVGNQPEEQIAVLNPYHNSANSVSVSPMAAPFVPQEGVVIELLSDGAQIVYIPPPALPSYHNDTPPPYQQ